jgi:hypothetical protein
MHAAAFSDKYIKGIDCQGPNVTNAKHLGFALGTYTFLGNHDNNQKSLEISYYKQMLSNIRYCAQSTDNLSTKYYAASLVQISRISGYQCMTDHNTDRHFEIILGKKK